jgi:hypothetical protein
MTTTLRNRTYITVKLGSKGEAVSRLQSELNEHGFDLKVDGDFGPKTLKAVKDFQASKGLTVDGIVGPVTWKAVLQPIDGPNPGPVMDKLAKIAKKRALGHYKESDGTYNYFRERFIPILGSQNWPWCAAFVHKCLEEACGRSLPLTPVTGPASYALCESWQKWAQQKGYWHNAPGFNPPKGAIILFDWSAATYPDQDWEDHIGVFLYKEGNAYVCAEGNVNDMTGIRKRYLKNIQGFIVLPDDWTM